MSQEHNQAAPEATDQVDPQGAQTVEQSQQSQQPDVATQDERIAELEKALLAAKAKIDEQKDSVVRAKAEVENMRRRAAQDVEKAHKFALEKFSSNLLPVIDNLERAIQFSDKENDAVKTVVEGVELTYQSFISTVQQFGMEVLDPQGDVFNPERHQAMSMQESAEHKPNTVTAVMQKGYVLNGRLLRPAMVMVSKAPTDESESESIDTTA